MEAFDWGLHGCLTFLNTANQAAADAANGSSSSSAAAAGVAGSMAAAAAAPVSVAALMDLLLPLDAERIPLCLSLAQRVADTHGATHKWPVADAPFLIAQLLHQADQCEGGREGARGIGSDGEREGWIWEGGGEGGKRGMESE